MADQDQVKSSYPNTILARAPDGTNWTFTLRDELHAGRPAWDMSLHHSLCWVPFDGESEKNGLGFWCLADLYNKDADGKVLGIVFDTPENPHGDHPAGWPTTATKSSLPPLGWWTRGRPWCGDRTSGGRTFELSPP